MKEKPLCFVIMGFGKKKDPITNRTINLDDTYKKIIQPAVKKSGCKCVRADEIIESGIIDESMYALLYCSDVVVADITTNNPNAIYELGVRHVLKPHSTIIIKEGDDCLPFDINHCRTMKYKSIGNEISAKEATLYSTKLKQTIRSILDNPHNDSPLYTYIPSTTRPYISDEEINRIVGIFYRKEDTIFKLSSKAKLYMANNDFINAEKIWEELSSKVKNDSYYIQQQALCRYKSKKPSHEYALTQALLIINKIKNANDTETLGIKGAINKRLWKETGDTSFLDASIENYRKSWYLFKDYYTGENYGNCLYSKAEHEKKIKDKTFYKMAAEKTYKSVIDTILPILKKNKEELKWKYATLSNCYLALKDSTNAKKYEKLFLKQKPLKLEITTFSETKKNFS